MNWNIPYILSCATLVTGLIVLVDTFVWTPKRKRLGRAYEDLPMGVDYAKAFFPVLLVVLIIRSFLLDNFRVPTGSLEPTIIPGDFVAINMFDYGLYWPVNNHKFFTLGKPQRGDIAPFRWPVNPTKVNYIKRVIGLPGDHISYHNKVFTINGKEAKQTFISKFYRYDNLGRLQEVVMNQEDLGGVKHNIYIMPERSESDFTDLVVPEGHYFMVGDNRDDSADSRFWGFVPEREMIGRAVMVWFSWDSEKYKVRWNRIGTRLSVRA